MNSLGFEEYERLSEAGRPVPVFREVPGDLRTPVSAFLSLASRAERAFLLESVVGGERLARYSFLGRDPVARLEVRGGRVVVHDAAGEHEEADGLLPALRQRLGSHRPAEIPGLPRFTGGAVGYLTWDAARLFERLPDHHGAAKGVVASFAFYDSLVAFDHVAPASRAHGPRRARLTRRVRARAGAHRALRAGPRLGAPAVVEPPGRGAAGPAADGQPRVPRRRAGRPRSTSRRATSSRSSSRASTRSTAASTRSPSTARCAW